MSPNIGILVVLILVFLVISSSKISLNVGNQRVNITETLQGQNRNNDQHLANDKGANKLVSNGIMDVLNQYKYLLVTMTAIGYLLFQISIEIGVLVLIVMLIKHKELSDGLNSLIDGTINRESRIGQQQMNNNENGDYENDYYENGTHNTKYQNGEQHEHMIGGMHPNENQFRPPNVIDKRFDPNFTTEPSKYTGRPEFEKQKKAIRPQYDDFKSSTITHQAYDPSIPNPEPEPAEEEDNMDELFDNINNENNDGEGFTAQDTRFTGSNNMGGYGNPMNNSNHSLPVQSKNDNSKFTQDLRSGNFEYNPKMDLDTEATFNSLSPDPNPSNIQMSISKVNQPLGYDTDDDIDTLFRDLDKAM